MVPYTYVRNGVIYEFSREEINEAMSVMYRSVFYSVLKLRNDKEDIAVSDTHDP